MELNEKQADLGLELMDSAEVIATDFQWYDYDSESHIDFVSFTKADLKRLKRYKKELDRDYNKFIKSLKGGIDEYMLISP